MLCYVNNEIISNFSKKVGRIAGYCLRLENSNKRFDNRDGKRTSPNYSYFTLSNIEISTQRGVKKC